MSVCVCVSDGGLLLGGKRVRLVVWLSLKEKCNCPASTQWMSELQRVHVEVRTLGSSLHRFITPLPRLMMSVFEQGPHGQPFWGVGGGRQGRVGCVMNCPAIG